MKHRLIPFKINVKLIIILGIMLVTFLTFSQVNSNSNTKINTFLSSELINLESKTTVSLTLQESFSNYIFDEIINREEVLQLISNANQASDSEKDIIRNNLFVLLEDSYKKMVNYDFRQLHFHLPNTESFLRFHKPEKYGDLLENIRASVAIANKEHIYLSGFEEGRIFNGFRYVYPLTYNKNHIGTVEISISAGSVIQAFSEIHPNMNTYFILNKNVVLNKVFEDEANNYKVSDFSSDYMSDIEVHTISMENNTIFTTNEESQFINKISLLIKDDLKGKKSFNLEQAFNGKYYLVQFLVVKNIVGDSVGYFVTTSENDYPHLIHLENIKELWLVGAIILFSNIAVYFIYNNHVELKILSNHDPLTRLYNRKKFNEFLSYEFSKFMRYNTIFSILIFDIDFFKRVNDTYGHNIGDEVLKKLSKSVEEYTRKQDAFARWGGEEFICLMPSTNLEEALIVGEKIRLLVEETVFDDVGHITVSVGVSEVLSLDDNTNVIIERADKALYRAKEGGRNRVLS
jgi:diguanylate cyclase (GGDEF)-like protein